MDRDPLNSRIPFPIDLPSSGRRFGPKTTRTIRRTTAISSGPTFGITEHSFRLLSTGGEPPEGRLAASASFVALVPGSGGVCGPCQARNDPEELVRLPDEQPVLCER